MCVWSTTHQHPLRNCGRSRVCFRVLKKPLHSWTSVVVICSLIMFQFPRSNNSSQFYFQNKGNRSQNKAKTYLSLRGIISISLKCKQTKIPLSKIRCSHDWIRELLPCFWLITSYNIQGIPQKFSSINKSPLRKSVNENDQLYYIKTSTLTTETHLRVTSVLR